MPDAKYAGYHATRDKLEALEASQPAPQPAREPLTDKQLVACIEAAGFTTWDSRMWELKRQVEAAHGITQKDAG